MQSAHTLIAPDEHSKRQWLTTLQKAIDTRRAGKAATTARPALPLEVAVAPITKQGSRTALFQVGKAASMASFLFISGNSIMSRVKSCWAMLNAICELFSTCRRIRGLRRGSSRRSARRPSTT